jgi:hypothetical protein
MSAVPCQYCGELRTVEQSFYQNGGGNWWRNPPCAHCGAPGWDQPDGEDPAVSQPPPEPEQS